MNLILNLLSAFSSKIYAILFASIFFLLLNCFYLSSQLKEANENLAKKELECEININSLQSAINSQNLAFKEIKADTKELENNLKEIDLYYSNLSAQIEMKQESAEIKLKQIKQILSEFEKRNLE